MSVLGLIVIGVVALGGSGAVGIAGVLAIVVALGLLVLFSITLYRPFFKRVYDILLSALAIIVLSPILTLLTVLGAIKMKGNPFFTQERPGKNGKIFKLIKFRSMTCEKDADGNLLPDEQRLTRYGKFLRSSSLDELPELINILKGDMSIVGPRPLLVEYLPVYNEEQHRRHKVRPGLTGLAQVNGRNAVTWEDKFRMDLAYIENVSFLRDVKILLETVKAVLKRDGITSESSATTELFRGTKV